MKKINQSDFITNSAIYIMAKHPLTENRLKSRLLKISFLILLLILPVKIGAFSDEKSQSAACYLIDVMLNIINTTPPPPQSLYQLIVQKPEGSGSTDPTPTTYNYHQIVTVWVKATPTVGWQFDHWLLDGSNIGSTNPYLVNMNANHTIKAIFTQTQPPPPSYRLTIRPPDGSGSTDPKSGNYTYQKVVTVPVQATAATGWHLDHWELDSTNIGSTNPYVVNMNVNHTLRAVFKQDSTPSSGSGIPGYPFLAIILGLILCSLILRERRTVASHKKM